MEKWIKQYLVPLLLLVLAAALFLDSRSVITVEPESGGDVPAASRPHSESEPQRAVPRVGSRLAVGARYASLEELAADQQAAGYVRTGYFGQHWPATVVEIDTDDDGIRFVRKNGTPHNYTGFDGYRMKMVRLDASGDRETIVVFRSAERR